MKSGEKSLVWMLSGVLAASALNAHAVSAGDDSAYRSIVARNIFDLQTPPPPPPPVLPPKQLPNVKLVGLLMITGKPQAVIWSQEPGVPPKQPVTTVMVAGQREGNIEVVEIDPAGKQARVQIDADTLTLKLEDKPAIGGPAPASMAVGPGGLRPALPGTAPSPVAPAPGTPNIIRRPPAAGGAYNPTPAAPGLPMGYNPAGTAGAITPAVNPTASMGLPTRPVRTDSPPEQQLSVEQQMILIEAQRDTALKQGDPIAKILPPTPLGALLQQQAGGNAPPAPASSLPPVPGRR